MRLTPNITEMFGRMWVVKPRKHRRWWKRHLTRAGITLRCVGVAGLWFLRIFGSECYVNTLKKFCWKFEDKAVLGNLVGHINDKVCYKVWLPLKHRLVKTRNVDFRPEKVCTNNNTILLHLRLYIGDSFRDKDNQNGEVKGFSEDIKDSYKSTSSSEEANSAVACLTEAAQEDLEPTNIIEGMTSECLDKSMAAMKEGMQAFEEIDQNGEINVEFVLQMNN
ncbi:hypothetical protein QE152_g1997 [Popillia japonica]|uniref:Retroviral polymerase SH3-like domain-containing protein n=1 Tax=Popillia japonica TaxID=7064 RepID=A0AAW1N2H5_POPJA